ncbi:MAG: YifB family Mg chelatase-like AAA ATPase [Epsilonproteobacteria bacterium]|nr:YifB family Mg chelatase-like AAA ATPase [Campylobacterota bacterium]
MKKLSCATLSGFDAKVVDVEVAFVRALPSFAIVGLAQTSIQESKERIKAALSAINFKFPPQKVTVNLSPSDLKKEGSHFDLPIALLIALQKVDVDFSDFFVFGELGLDGKLKDTSSIFALILSLAKDGVLKKVIVPKESLEKVEKIPNIEIYPVNSLQEALNIFIVDEETKITTTQSALSYNYITHNNQRYYYMNQYPLDFYDIKGQEQAKRASLIAAAGMHNILFEGSPGCGKSMSAKRLQYILPPMYLDEILEIAKLEALEGKEPHFKPIRPMRSPHHSSTKASIFGGGSRSAKIGEIALSHHGLLFFDEFPHFQKSTLESLREPLEDHKLLISRVNTKTEYQTKFLFAAAMNPCPCGNLLSLTKECRCSELEINRYKNRLSSPLLDRIDIYIQMDEIKPEDKPTITSQEMFEKIKSTFLVQHQRGQIEFNGKLNDQEIVKFCTLNEESQSILDKAIQRYELSQRAINKSLKVARTIADLDQSKQIEKCHLIESLTYRIK